MPANTIRFAVATIFLGGISVGKNPKAIKKISAYNPQTLRIILIATVFSMMFGALLSADSIQYLGASKGSAIVATAPLFALPISIKYLNESISWKILVGTILTVIGVWFVI